LHAVESGRPDEAVAALRQLITLLRDSAIEPNQSRGKKSDSEPRNSLTA
jgi:hypothetical protein